jgi:hypothetical protein
MSAGQATANDAEASVFLDDVPVPHKQKPGLRRALGAILSRCTNSQLNFR